jgi:hypothetical protein
VKTKGRGRLITAPRGVLSQSMTHACALADYRVLQADFKRQRSCMNSGMLASEIYGGE